MSDDEKPLRQVMRHIRNVQDNCELLAERLIEQGRAEFARRLLANSLAHDQSKLRGIEWAHLNGETKKMNGDAFKLAHQSHVESNPHHPEYWGGIDEMPAVYIAEMVCDWKARSDEMGTDLREWVKDEASKRYKFTLRGSAYKIIKNFMDLLLDPAFS